MRGSRRFCDLSKGNDCFRLMPVFIFENSLNRIFCVFLFLFFVEMISEKVLKVVCFRSFVNKKANICKVVSSF